MATGMAPPQRSGYLVAPGAAVQGELTVPGDKSISHRALMLGAIAAGTTDITGFLAGEDCLATLRALEAMGVKIEHPQEQHVIVHGVGAHGLRAAAAPLDMGNAGTAMRLFMGLLASQSFDSTLLGDASLMRRPMERVAVPLRQMGADIRTQDGRPPVRIARVQRLRAIDYALPVASAQVKSALLLAALQADGRTCLREPATSRDHTERMLRAFAVRVPQQGATIGLEGGQTLRGAPIRVPADFSSAAFFIVAACLGGSGLRIRNVGVNPTRTGLLRLLQQMGAAIRIQPCAPSGEDSQCEPIADIEVHPAPLRGIEVPAALVSLSIDEFPALFIAAACAAGETVLRGAAELRVKETDRLAVMADGLTALGVHNELQPDGIRIRGGEGFSGGAVDSHGDHRIAMAFVMASVRARAPIEVRDVANVATSFPGFVATAGAAGLQIETR
ncbi:MAG TPA: 3-phosphoshikimate 1-carboxyvinyltransferase [Steroidobacteraceae bacterium]